jgi:sugar/nucleoside kinase (ribokinase family)
MPTDLCVVGLVYFEVDCPRRALAPEPGEELFVARLPVRLGGALNTASVARALGAATRLAYPRGDGLTDVAVAAQLDRLGIAATTWAVGDDPAISLVFRDAGDRAFVSASDFAGLARCPPLPAARWIHVAGLREAEALAPRLTEARARGARVSVSASWATDLLDALHREQARPWDTLFVNAKELARAAGATGAPPSWRAIAGAADEIIVTDGAGAALYRGAEVVEIDSDPAEVVDATGAGDAFVAGVLAGRLRGADDRAALALGVAAARLILGIPGGVAVDPDRFAALRETPS